MAYLSDDEIDAIQHLDKSTPYSILNVGNTVFSVARHYGGMTYQGRYYLYVPTHDECVRSDVVRFVEKLRRKRPPTPEPQASLL